ncbi:hypothetical protein [Pandoraea pnomenusa]|uniref:hypothetical protein n=1 Tax=Pandoraea pnomenusa TaxID=93220 RepID=UPI0012DAAB5C|nr:hypothetical protein [Pandoraea pnomenusa]
MDDKFYGNFQSSERAKDFLNAKGDSVTNCVWHLKGQEKISLLEWKKFDLHQVMIFLCFENHEFA